MLVHQIEQAAGRCHQHFDAARKRAHLRLDRHAADRERDLERGVAAIGAETVGDLAGQFARRRKHQHAAGFCARALTRLLTR